MARKQVTHRRWLAMLGASTVLVALFAVLPLPAAAADLRQGSDVTVGPSETVNDDIYAGAGTISISGTVNGDVIAGGGTITVSGTITRDLIVGGGTINVTGHVGGSIIAAGGNLTLNGPVERDIVVTGGISPSDRAAPSAATWWSPVEPRRSPRRSPGEFRWPPAT